MANPTSNVLFKVATFFKNPENVAKFAATAVAAYSVVKTYFQSRQEPAHAIPPLEEERFVSLTQAIQDIEEEEEENLRTVYFGPQPFRFVRGDFNQIPPLELDDATGDSDNRVLANCANTANQPQPTIFQQLRDKSFDQN